MDPVQGLYDMMIAKGLLTPDKVDIDKFKAKMSDPAGREWVYSGLKERKLVEMDYNTFATNFTPKGEVKKKSGGESLASQPDSAQPVTQEEQPSGESFPTVTFTPADVHRDVTAAYEQKVSPLKAWKEEDVYNIRGDEDPVSYGEDLKKAESTYAARKRYDDLSNLRTGSRHADNTVQFAKRAQMQANHYDELLEQQFPKWKDTVSALRQQIDAAPDGSQEKSAAIKAYNEIIGSPEFDKYQAAQKGLEKGRQEYDKIVSGDDEFGTYMRLKKKAQDDSSASYDRGDFWAPKARWAARKSAQVMANILTTPRTIGQAIPGETQGEIKVAEGIASWMDDLAMNFEAFAPKPEALQVGVFEDVYDFNGEKVLVDNEGNPRSIIDKDGKRRRPDEAFIVQFKDAKPTLKSKVEFQGAMPLIDKVVEAGADLMVMRAMGGGSKLGVVGSTFATMHKNAYDEYIRSNPNASPEDAAQYALVTSTLNGVAEAYLGDLESMSLTKRAASAGTNAATARRIVGLSPTQAAKEKVLEVVRQTGGEIKEEIVQGIQGDMTRYAFESETSPLKAETDVKSLGETVLVTALLTAPLAAFGLRGYTTNSRRSALMTAIENPQVFKDVLVTMAEQGKIQEEEALIAAAKIDKLAAYAESLPDGLTQEQRSMAISAQEFAEDKRAQADASQGVMPVQRKAMEQEAREAEAVALKNLQPQVEEQAVEEVAVETTVESTEQPVAEVPKRAEVIADQRTIEELVPETTVVEEGEQPIDALERTRVAATQEVSDAVDSVIKDLAPNIEVPRMKVESAVASALFQPMADKTRSVAQVAEDVATSLIQRSEPVQPETTTEAVTDFFARGGRVSPVEKNRAPQAAETFFEDGAPSIRQVAEDIYAETRISSPEEIQSEIEAVMNQAPDKKFSELASRREVDTIAQESGVPAEDIQAAKKNIDAATSSMNPEEVMAAEAELSSLGDTPEAIADYIEQNNINVNGITQEGQSPVMAQAPETEDGGSSQEAAQQNESKQNQDLPASEGTAIQDEGSLRITSPTPESLAAEVSAGKDIREVVDMEGETTAITDTIDEVAIESAEVDELINTKPIDPTAILGPGVTVVESGDTIVVVNSSGVRERLAELGGRWVPGRGWVFPVAQKEAVMAVLNTPTRPAPVVKSSAGTPAMVTVHTRKGFRVFNRRNRAINAAASVDEAIDTAIAELGENIPTIDQTVVVVVDKLRKAYPNIKVSTDPNEVLAVGLRHFGQNPPPAFVAGGKVYLDLAKIGPETAIHEFAHIWVSALSIKSPELYARGIELVSNTSYSEEVAADPRYSALSPEMQAEEALVRAIAEKGVRINERTAWERFQEFFDAVMRLFRIKNPSQSIHDFATYAAYNTLKGGNYTSPEIARIQGDIAYAAFSKEESQVALKIASLMEAEGKTNAEIRSVTGWFRLPSGLWSFKSDIDLKDNTVLNATSTQELIGDVDAIDIPIVKGETTGLVIDKDGGVLLQVKDGELRRKAMPYVNHIKMLAETTGVKAGKVDGELTAFNAFEALTPFTEKVSEIIEASGFGQQAQVANEDIDTELDWAAQAAIGTKMPYEGQPGFELTQGDEGYDLSRDILRNEALKSAASAIINNALDRGEYNPAFLVNRIAERLGMDRNIVRAIYDMQSSLRPGGKNNLDFRKKQQREMWQKRKDAARKFIRGNFTASQLLPKDIFQMNLRRQNEINAMMIATEIATVDLEKSMKQEFGGNPSREQRKVVDDIMKGNLPIDTVSPELGSVISALRTAVDKLSKRLMLTGGLTKAVTIQIMEDIGVVVYDEDGAITPDAQVIVSALNTPPYQRTEEHKEIIDKFIEQHSTSFGTYLNRSYRVHDFADWPDRIPPEVWNNARQYQMAEFRRQEAEMVDQLAESRANLEQQREHLVQKVDDIRASIAEDIKDIKGSISRGRDGSKNKAANVKRVAELEALQKELEVLDSIERGSKDFMEAAITVAQTSEIMPMRELRKAIKDLWAQEQRMLISATRVSKKLNSVRGHMLNIDDYLRTLIDNQQPGGPNVRKGQMLGAKDLSILKKRKDLPEEIRALYGEYEDPAINAAKSILKMSNIIANIEFLNELRSRYEGVYFFEDGNKPEGNYVQFGASGNKALSPLDGMWTTPDILEAFETFYSPSQMAAWQRSWIVNFVQAVKVGKTVLSISSHPRNFIGNFVFHVANGWGLKPSSELMSAWRARKDNATAWREVKARYTRLGVLGGSAKAQDIDEATRDIESFFESRGWLDGAMSMGAGQLVSVYKKFQWAYAKEDEIHRVIGFESEARKHAIALFGKKYSELSHEEAAEVDEIAARKLSMLMPTADYVSKFVQNMRRFPFLATFITFSSEIMRITHTTYSLAFEEINDPRTRAIGMRRLAGQTAVIAGINGLIMAIRSFFDYDDDYWKALNEFLPAWNKNAQLVPLARSEKGVPRYVNLSYTNPYSYLGKAWNSIMNGKTPEEAAIGSVMAVIDPFATPELSFNTLEQLRFSVDDRGQPIIEKSLKGFGEMSWTHPENMVRAARFAAKKLAPGIAGTIGDAYDIAFDEVDRSGRFKSWADWAILNGTGFRVESMDPKVQLGYNLNQLDLDKRSARKIFTSEQSKVNRAWENMHRDQEPGKAREENFEAKAPQRLNKYYDIAMEGYIDVLKEARKQVTAGKTLGVPENVIISMLKDANFSHKNGEIEAIMSGNYSKIRIKFEKKGKY